MDGDDEEPTEIRLYNTGKEMIERRMKTIERKRAEQEKQEMSQAPHKPKITPMGNAQEREDFNEFIEIQQKWKDESDAKLKRKRELRVKAEDTETTKQREAWKMSKGSSDIMRYTDYHAPSSSEGWQKNLARYTQIRNKKGESPAFKPEINKHSARLSRNSTQRKGDVGKRLHSIARDRDEGLHIRQAGYSPPGHQRSTSHQRSNSVGKGKKDKTKGKSRPLAEQYLEDLPESSSFGVYAARMRVAELAEALEFEVERNLSFDNLSREIKKEAGYLTSALREEREKNDLLQLELQKERSKSASLEAALNRHLSDTKLSRNIGEPLVSKTQILTNISPLPISLSPRRLQAEPKSVVAPPIAIDLDDL